MKVTIDPEFAALIPDVSEAHAKELEDAVLADGQFLNPLVVWKHKNILLDGHRRNKIHVKHPTLPMPKPVVLDFETRDEAHDWIIRHQLSKRNITEEQRRYLIGKLYLDKKQNHGGAREQDATVASCSDGKTAEKIALSEGVSERTVHNNADFAAAIDAVKSVAPTVANAVLSGDVKATTKDLKDLAELPRRDAKKVDREIAAGDSTSVKAAVRKISGGVTFNTDELEDEDEPDPNSLEAVQAELADCAKQLRSLSHHIRTVLGAKKNEVTRPWCGCYSLLTVSQPLLHAARTFENDMPVGGTPSNPVLKREEVAANV
jgi:hypothetical protein